MPRSSDKTIAAIQEAGFRLFFQRGYARVSMDDIAAEAGVTKRTLYYHFDSKDTLVGWVVAKQAELSLREARKWADSGSRSAQDFVDGFFAKLGAWVETPGWTGSGFTRLTLELADRPGHPVRAAASRHKKSLEAWLAEELTARGCRSAGTDAALIATLVEGATLLALIHSDPGYVRQARLAATQILSNGFNQSR